LRHLNASIRKILVSCREHSQPRELKARIRDIHRDNAGFCSSGFEQTAHLVHGWLADAGLTDVEIVHAPADGKTLVGDWTLPKAWDGWHSSLVPVVDGEDVSGPMALRTDDPCALVLYSVPTPPGGKLLRVVGREELAATRGDVSDCLLFCVSGSVDDWSRLGHLMKQRRAGGIAIWNPDLPANERHWLNDFFLPDNKHQQIGFSLTAREGRALEKLRKKYGPKLRVRAEVQSRLYDGTIPLVTGVIRGQGSGKELWSTAQLCEQGAWDNHGGVVATVESFRQLQEAISRGRIPRPHHDLRVVLGMEVYGFMAYGHLRRDFIREQVIGGYCMEGLGHALDDPNACLMLFNTYEHSPHWGDALLPHVARHALKQLLPGATPRTTVSPPWLCDNCLADPQIGIPTPMVIQKGGGRDVWHTSMDTPNRMSGEALRALAGIGAAYLHVAASEEPGVLADRTELTLRHVLRILKRGFDCATGGTRPVDNAETAAYWLEKSQAYLRSALGVGPSSRAREAGACDRRLRDALKRCWSGRPSFKKPQSTLEKKLAKMIPARRVFGNLTLRKLRGKAAREAEKYETAYSMAYNAPVFWMDGKRSCHDIYRRLVQEREAIPLEVFHDFCLFLQGNGYINIK